MPTKVLVTGVYGLIGNAVYKRLLQAPEKYDVYGMARRQQPSARLPGDEMALVLDSNLFVANLDDFAAVQKAVQDIDCVVHLAANPNGDASWDSVLNDNIIGSHNLFEACRLAGVRRLIYASTMQVIFGYALDEPFKSLFHGHYDAVKPEDIPRITHLQPTRPMNDYAASKVWGEGMAHMYAYRHNMSCIVLRIGWVDADEPVQHPSARCQWCSRRDIAQLVQCCIDAPDGLRFDIFFGLSNNPYNVADVQHARDVLGYAPQDGI